MFERPLMLWLLLTIPLAIAPGWIAMRAGQRRLGALSSALRLLCLVAIVLMLAGFRVPLQESAKRLGLVVLMDESRSIAPDQKAWMMSEISTLRGAMDHRDQLGVIGFGRDASVLAMPADPRLVTVAPVAVDANATNIAGALVTAAGILPAAFEKRLLLLSDGDETVGDASGAIPRLVEDGTRVYTDAPPPSAAPRVAITAFAAPAVVRADTSFALRLDVMSEAQQAAPAIVKLFGDGAALGSQQTMLAPGMNQLQLPYRVGRAGAYLIKAVIAVAPPLLAANPSAETPLAVNPPPRVLVISDSPPESLLAVLKLRGYEVATAAPRRLPLRPSDYLAYQAVIVANTSAEALDENAQRALVSYVADYGGGLAVLGASLKDYHFHGAPLEQILPVNFMPQPPPPSREPIAVYLLIDRSNSMSYDSRYPAVRDGERIGYAKKAAAALLNQLDDTDYAGVIAFDSEPYVLGHLRPVGENRDELLNRVARLEPGGGTDFKEALETAEREILGSGVAVREILLLTDGDTNRQYHDHDQLMADLAKQRIPVSTIRIGPDLENLRLLQDFASMTGGDFYRVEDITRLPQLLVRLTHEAQDFKLHEHARVDLGAHSSILDGISTGGVPPLDFFAVTDAKDGAAVPLVVRKGAISAPLLATWQYELGRTAVFAGDPDSVGSIEWLKWNHYAEFWSQLVSWIARPGDAGPFNLRVSDAPDGAMRIEAERADGSPVENLFCRISGLHQTSDIALSQVDRSIYRGESAPLARGKYTLSLTIKAGDTERLLLRREVATLGAENVDAAELRLRPDNYHLLRQLAQGTEGKFAAPVSEILAHSSAKVITWRTMNQILLPFAMLLLLGDVLVRRRFIGD